MSFFSRVFRKEGGSKKNGKQNGVAAAEPPKPKWTDAWLRTEVSPEEVQELLHGCTIELKARGLDIPFLLLPFRPSSDPSAARTFIRNYFNPPPERPQPLRGESLMQELRLTEPMVLCSVMKWCWSRLPGGVVTWEAYELFKMGEQDSSLARDAFTTFIPISMDSDARTKIIFDFFEFLAAIAAHGKSNGLGGRKLSRYAGWWAFEHSDTGKGFESSYKTWANAADATSHLFFAYLRSLSPDSIRGTNGIATLPISLQALVQATEYPPQSPSLLQVQSTKVVMIVNTVSPTPFALLRRATNFEYRDSDRALKEFSNYEDPVKALTEECRRVLKCISSANQSDVSSSKASTSLRDASWSRFQDIGFGGSIEESDGENDVDGTPLGSSHGPLTLRSAPSSRTADLDRPTTPSWADFLSSGFPDEHGQKNKPPFLLPPEKKLPPVQAVRGQSSHSHKRMFDQDSQMEPGELASITTLDLDDSFWWVWISSLSSEETTARKAVFGRCSLIETVIAGGKWLVLEEQVKGAAPEPEEGAYIAEKRSFFSFRSRKGRLARRQSSAKKVSSSLEPYSAGTSTAQTSKTSIGPDQHARIQAAAAELQRKRREQEREQQQAEKSRREEMDRAKTNSTMTLQSQAIISEASQALKWASNYDKHAIRDAYLSNSQAGTGLPADTLEMHPNGHPLGSSPVQNTEEASAPTPAPAPAPAPAVQEREVVKNASESPIAVKEEEAPAVPPKSQNSTQEIPKTSVDSNDERKKLKKKQPNTGIKGMFGSMRKVEPKSTVAAAKAAIESRAAQAAQESRPALRKPLVEETLVTAPKAQAQSPKELPPFEGPPKTKRDDEFDSLSRVNTNEQAEADRQFASFDHQSPFVDQPAFVPQDSPVSESPSPAAQSRVSKETSERRPPVATSPVSPRKDNGAASPTHSIPTQDRWAQIRKNAAAMQSGVSPVSAPEPAKQTLPPGDMPTGQETIEMRAARIRARVAELTKNMES